MNVKGKHIALIIMLPLVLSFQMIQLGNVHFHKLANGKVVKHSHLYKKSPSNKEQPVPFHKHTRKEFLLFQLFHNDADDNISTEFILSDVYFEFEILKVRFVEKKNYRAILHYGLRAPPAFA